jgi:hypothetical protein
MTLLSLLIPSKIKVSRTVLINNTDKARVFEQVATLPNWKNWHPIFKTGDAKIIFSPPAINTASYAEIVYGTKSARIIITQADSNLIKFTLQSPGETDIENEIVVLAIPAQPNVQVEWLALNKLKWYPWEKFYAIFIDKLTGPGYEQALTGLKGYLEANH